jgi:S-DNA-T family DNA segregation ATPase FtsK/SpoIIIE
VHVVLSCEQRGGLPPALASSVQQRIVLRMASAEDYSMLDVASDVISADSPPGRGLIGDYETQVAVLGGTNDVGAQAAAIRAFAESMRRAGGAAAPPIQRLPDSVPLDELPIEIDGEPVIGLSGTTLGPVTMPTTGSYLVAGPRGSGRTTTLLTLLQALRRARPDTALYYLGQRRSPLAGLDIWADSATGASEVADLAGELVAELAAAPRSGGANRMRAVFVEDVGEFVESPADFALQELARALLGEDQLFVVEGETSALSSSYGLLGSAKASRSGLALQPGESDGQLLYRTNFPRLGRGELPPGRAVAVRLGRCELVQIAVPSPVLA